VWISCISHDALQFILNYDNPHGEWQVGLVIYVCK
jgi:hypothetical protein